MKVKYAFLIVFTLLALLLSACGGAVVPATDSGEPEQPAATEAPEEPGLPAVLRIGWAGSPDTINPGTAVLSEAYTIFALVYDTIYEYQLDGTYTLDVAESA
ncbi:MAG TPA: hypothetical protein VHO49_02640, partial [Anaerolineales bacterium]|nr:hypothetical protein [Anaerolineales bacterium]